MLSVSLLILMSGALGLLISIIFSFLIVLSNSFFKYGSFRLFNEIMVLGLAIYGWFYTDSFMIRLLFFVVLSSLYHLYRIISEIYSIDARFRTLVLALGKDRIEYATFSLKRVRRRIFGTFFKYIAILFAAYSVSQSLHPLLIGGISFIVGVIIILLRLD
ncbi:MAG: hypothetical protein H0Z24_01685 [Thermosipho sp. (in: Bacteria)]|nr:hypothetical protein [Thermosipho sp. (in: thermotogales)]